MTRRRFGPGMLVAAAFIGPGTLTTASIAGASYGYGLLWALALSLLATYTLQEMAARIGLVTRQGLAEAARTALTNPTLRLLVLGLIVLAIGVGNAAYQSGNLLGAALGASTLLPGTQQTWTLALGLTAAALLASGRYQLLERTLIALVALMALVFLTVLFMNPPTGDLWSRSTTGGPGYTLTSLALIGTTVVPYNLFLHAQAVQQRWPASVSKPDALKEVRRDAAIAIGLGGLLTFAILSTAAVAFLGSDIELNAASLATPLEPVLGPYAKVCFALGLLAAGLTSAITAPLAASWALCGALGWRSDLDAPGFRGIWLVVLLTGMGFALAQSKPLAAILLAQAANGLLLPIIGALLLWLANQHDLLGDARNRWLANSVGGGVLLLISWLSLQRLASLLS